MRLSLREYSGCRNRTALKNPVWIAAAALILSPGLAGHSKFKRLIFDTYVTDPAVAAAFNQLSKK